MSKSAWCGLNSKGDTLKIHDKCPNPRCNCQKLITFLPKQFQPEGKGFKNTKEKFSKGFQTAWNNFPKPAVNVSAPCIGMAVGAKTKNPKVAQTTTNILKNISGGKILGPTDMHGHGFRLKVM